MALTLNIEFPLTTFIKYFYLQYIAFCINYTVEFIGFDSYKCRLKLCISFVGSKNFLGESIFCNVWKGKGAYTNSQVWCTLKAIFITVTKVNKCGLGR